MKILLVDEWGGGTAIRLANDIAPTGASVYILREFEFRVPLPRNAHLLPPVPLAGKDIFIAIDRAVGQIDPDVVMPTEEQTLLQIWNKQPAWLDRVQPRIDLASLDCYRDKRALLEFARQQGVPIPRTLVPKGDDTTEISARIADFGLPVVIKGTSGSSGEQVCIAHTPEQALDAFRRFHAATGEVPALQQFIDGAPYQVGGLFIDGKPVRFLAGEKTATLPRGTGPAIELISRAAPELLDHSQTILSGLGFSGIAGLDFIRDREGHFYFLEINPRVWGSYGFAQALGIDLFDAWASYLQGIGVPINPDYPVEIRWAKMPEYLFAEPRSRGHLLKRLCHPIAIRSLAWSQPYLLLHQLRRIYWELRK